MAKNDKQTKKIIVIIGVIIAVVVGAFFATKIINGEFSEDYGQVSTTYDDYVKLAGKYNGYIDSTIKAAEDAVKDKDLGDDKTKLEELEAKKQELLSYKVEIKNRKPKNRNELIKENNRLIEATRKIDSTLNNGILRTEMVDEYIETFSTSGTKVSQLSKEISEIINEITEITAKREKDKAEMEKINNFLSNLDGAKFEESGTTLTVSKEEFKIHYVNNVDKVFKISDMQKIEQTSSGGYRFVVSGENETSVTGYTMYLEEAFDFSADGKEVTYCLDLGCSIFKR